MTTPMPVRVPPSSFRPEMLPPVLLTIAREIRAAGGRVYLIGGWVRDAMLGIASDDYDLEIYRMEFAPLMAILERFGKPILVGKAFGVIHMRIGGLLCDFSFPRTESKVSKGHRGFLVTPDANLEFVDASRRRDFTINAMGVELPDMTLADCHGGVADLEAGVLRHVSAAFGEDPLRVLRGVQFAARFGMRIAPDTIALCRTLPLGELSRERMFDELEKLLLKADRPSIGLALMREMDVTKYFPELRAIIGVPQNPAVHPEGDVWTHTLMVMDEAARLRGELATDRERTAFMFGALCHDFGKALTTEMREGVWASPDHEARGEEPVRAFLARLTHDRELVEEIVLYVREHRRPHQLFAERDAVKCSAIRRLALRIDIVKLVRLGRADHLGRATDDAARRAYPAGDWLLARAAACNVMDGRPVPYLTGQMLLELGLVPGRRIGRLIRESFELQLDGHIRDAGEARAWAEKKLRGGRS